MKNKLFCALAIIAVLLGTLWANQPVVVLFYGQGCPHCAEERTFLDELAKKKQFELESYEVYYNASNVELFRKAAQIRSFEIRGVPTTIIGNEVFIGFSAEIGEQIEAEIDKCTVNQCPDPLGRDETEPEKQNSTGNGVIVEPEKPDGQPNEGKNGTGGGQNPESEQIEIPFMGKIDPKNLSLPMLTVVLAGLDSFNPCAFFVLMFLLSILMRAGSKKRMLMIGGVFVFFSFLLYFLFMVAWLNFFMIAGSMALVTTIAGIVAVLVGIINVKDFFALGEGITLSIPDDAKRKLVAKMKQAAESVSFPAMICATALLASAANMYELLCTAGFPMVFTRALTLSNLTTAEYYLYLAAYNLVYVIPLGAIVVFFSFTLGARRLKESEGELLKLISGLMMLGLGLILLLAPSLLNNPLAGIVLMVAALAIAIVLEKIAKKSGKAKIQQTTENKPAGTTSEADPNQKNEEQKKEQ